jgi:hypothetical protein
MPCSKKNSTRLKFCIGVVAALLTTACAEKAKEADKSLPLSLLAVMRANLEIPADGIWAIQGMDSLSEPEWQLAEQDATNLVLAASLISKPGTGKNDQTWTANADWQSWSAETLKTALQIHDAVKTKNLTAMSDAANHLTEVCQSCHDKYRPESPSDGVARYPFYPVRKLPK